ncbi:MAG: hypothetical protein HY554_08285 [Elusimicrobia bacterium]|nr:hypothetical protein [Elusimicrobiota bacterium]
MDVPYWDDWDHLSPGALTRELPWRWIATPHVESPHVPTKLQFWLAYRTDGLDFSRQQLVAFSLYALALLAAASLLRRCAALPPWCLWGCLALALSPKGHEALEWAHDSHHHYALLGLLLGAELLFRERASWPRALAGTAFAFVAMLAHASGFAAIGTLWAGYCAFQALRARRGWAAGERAAALFPAAALGLGLAAWLYGYVPSPDQPAGTPPTDGRFWRFLLNLVSWGFGMDQVSVTLGLLCLLLALAPVLSELRRRGRAGLAELPSGHAAVYTVLAALVVVLALAAYGRAAFGIGYAKASRYAVIAVLVVPFAAAAWQLRLAGSRRRESVLAALLAFAALGHADNWDFSLYDLAGEERRLGVQCVRAYYAGAGDGYCPMIYPKPIPERLDHARELDVSFYRRLRDGR